MSERYSESAAALALMLAVTAVGANALALSPLLTDVAADFHTDAVTVSRVMGAYGGATSVAAFLIGPRIDAFGLRRMLVVGLGVLALAAAFSAVAPSWPMLALGQSLAGVGAGIILPSAYGLAGWIGGEKRGAVVLGRVITGWGLSMVAGVPAATLIAHAFGWRAVYMALAVLAICALAGGMRLPAPARAAPGNAHLLRVWGFPGMPRLLAVTFIFMACFYAVYGFLGTHVRLALGVSGLQAGLCVLFYGTGFIAAGFGDRLIDRFGPARILPYVMGVLAAVYLAMAGSAAHYALMLVCCAVWGFVNHFGINVVVLSLVGVRPHERGAILGVNSAVTYAASLAGVLLAGPIFDAAGMAVLTCAAAVAMSGAAMLARGARRVGAEAAVGRA